MRLMEIRALSRFRDGFVPSVASNGIYEPVSVRRRNCIRLDVRFVPKADIEALGITRSVTVAARCPLRVTFEDLQCAATKRASHQIELAPLSVTRSVENRRLWASGPVRWLDDPGDGRTAAARTRPESQRSGACTRTRSTHRRGLREKHLLKLNISSRAEEAVEAVRRGLV